MKQFFDLNDFLDYAWLLMKRGVADPKSAARNPTFATISKDSYPAMRTVVLRSAERKENILEIYTDIQTDKVIALKNNNRAALHFWIPKAKFQIRASVVVDIVQGSRAQTAWNKVPLQARASYGSIPRPGFEIESPFDYEKISNQDNFAVLKCDINELDLLFLGDRHQRAVYNKKDFGGATWLAP